MSRTFDIHRALLRRLIASWLLISIGVGAGLFWYGTRRINEQLTELALAESNKVSVDMPSLLDKAHFNDSEVERRVASLVRERFVQIRIYGRDRRLVTESTNPRFESLKGALGARAEGFPPDQTPRREQFMLGEDMVVKVFVPLRSQAGVLSGYFDGVFLIDRATRARLQRDAATTLGLALAAVLLTTLLLYPVIISLHRDVVRYSHDLLRGNLELMQVLGSAVAKRDSATNTHSYRVSIYAIRLAEAVGLGRDAIRDLMVGAFLHDVGKIGISDSILRKSGELTAAEFAAMQSHVELGVEILEKSTWLLAARDVVACHHEKWDGSGYVRGLAGAAIPLNARIFAIVDVFDALLSRRPYKAPLSFTAAMALLQQKSGSHFDPSLLAVFATIAESLYAQVSEGDSQKLEAQLQELIARYFFDELGP